MVSALESFAVLLLPRAVTAAAMEETNVMEATLALRQRAALEGKQQLLNAKDQDSAVTMVKLV